MRPSPLTVRRLALASVLSNCAIVVTGGAVRLTSSGLGCPTWPRCTDATLTPTAEYAAHGLIEFGNRLLTFALAAVVVAVLVATRLQRPRRRDLVRLATLGLLGIPAQALLGGITVLTGLNPWSVMLHFLLSMVLIAVAVVLLQRSSEGDRPARRSVSPVLGRLAAGLLALTAVVLAVGTVVTGSGPHSGDPAAGRTGLSPAAVSQLHADLVFLLVGATVGLWAAYRAAGHSDAARATRTLLTAELAQGVLGFVQYATDLPVVLVGLHLAGACVVLVAAVRVVLATRDRGPLLSPAAAGRPRRTAPVPAGHAAGTATAR